jgi:hypothetical protein
MKNYYLILSLFYYLDIFINYINMQIEKSGEKYKSEEDSPRDLQKEDLFDQMLE